MSAVIKSRDEFPPQPQSGQSGVEVLARHPGQDPLLTPAALVLLAGLHRRFEAPRRVCLAARRERQAFFDAGGLPDFREDTAELRKAD